MKKSNVSKTEFVTCEACGRSIRKSKALILENSLDEKGYYCPNSQMERCHELAEADNFRGMALILGGQ